MKTNRLFLAFLAIAFSSFWMSGHLSVPPRADFTKSPELPRAANVIAFEKTVKECGLKWLYTEPFVENDFLTFMHVFRQKKHNPYEIEGKFSGSGKFYRFLISGIRDYQAESFEKTALLIKNLLQIMEINEADVSLLIKRLFIFCKSDSPGRYDDCSTEPIGKGESFLGKLFIKVLISSDIFEILIINTESEHIKTVIKNNKP